MEKSTLEKGKKIQATFAAWKLPRICSELLAGANPLAGAQVLRKCASLR
jgi:hypothetical protein